MSDTVASGGLPTESLEGERLLISDARAIRLLEGILLMLRMIRSTLERRAASPGE
jgi:hypothetical protein